MDINNLLSTFEQRLRIQRFSNASIITKVLWMVFCVWYQKSEELDTIKIEKYVFLLIEKKNISASYQRMVVASIDKFYRLVLNIQLPIKLPLPFPKIFAKYWQLLAPIYDNNLEAILKK